MKRKIDRYFKNKLNVPQQPPAEAWEFIQNHLAQKEKKRFLPLWARISGISALVLMLIGGGFMFDVFEFEKNLEPNTESLTGNSDISSTQDNSSEHLNRNSELNQISNHSDRENQTDPFYLEKNSLSDHSQQPNSIGNTNQTTAIYSKSLVYENNSTHLNSPNSNPLQGKENLENSSVLLNEKINSESLASNALKWNPNPWSPEASAVENNIFKTHQFEVSAQEKAEEEQLLAVKSKQHKKKKYKAPKNKMEFDRFYISGFISPMALNSFVGNSMLADEMGQYKTENNVTLSYGVKGAYAVSPKVKIRTGITVTGFEQITQNVPLVANVDNSAISSLYGSSQHGRNDNNIRYNGELRIEDVHTAYLTGNELNHKGLEGNIQQQSQYIEIPVEAEVALFQTNSIGISATGGGSTWLLSKNKIYAHTDDYTEELGRADNLNKTSFSANAGL